LLEAAPALWNEGVFEEAFATTTVKTIAHAAGGTRRRFTSTSSLWGEILLETDGVDAIDCAN
jgi:hypothetical protein